MLSKRIPVERDLIEEISQISNLTSKKRTKLHSSNTVQWLRKRFNQTANINYLHFPEELQKEVEVQNVFRNFDADRSGKLSLGEFHKMLKEAHIDIELEDLKQFYEKVDTDHDVALDFKEFKNCTLSEQANHHFSEMVNRSLNKARSLEREYKSPVMQVKQIQEQQETQEDDAKQNHFLPRSFGNLMNYITYSSKRSELKKIVNNESVSPQQRFEGFRKLFDLKMGKDVYTQHLSTKFDPSHIQQLRRNLSIGSPKGLGVDESSLLGVSSSAWDRSSMSRLPAINRTEMEVEHLKEELNDLAKKARYDAKKALYKKKVRKPRHLGLVDLAERSLSVEPPDQKLKASLVSSKVFANPVRPVDSYKDLIPIHSPRRGSIAGINKADKVKFVADFEIKDTANESNKIEILTIDTEESEMGGNGVTGSYKGLSRNFIGPRKIKHLNSPTNKQKLKTEESMQTFETLETRPSDRVVTLSEMPVTVFGTIVESQKAEFSPVNVSKMTWTELDEVGKNRGIVGVRKPQIKAQMNSYSVSHSKLPLEYVNVSPVYGKLEKGKLKGNGRKKLTAVLQNAPRIKKQSLGMLKFTHAFEP